MEYVQLSTTAPSVAVILNVIFRVPIVAFAGAFIITLGEIVSSLIFKGFAELVNNNGV
ncbi:MAG: hypothetical protein AABX16_03335 [Nanoarchaeota archaeon]